MISDADLAAAHEAVLAEVRADAGSVQALEEARRQCEEILREASETRTRESCATPSSTPVTSQLHGEAFAASLGGDSRAHQSHQPQRRRRPREADLEYTESLGQLLSAASLESLGTAATRRDALLFESLLASVVSARAAQAEAAAKTPQTSSDPLRSPYMVEMQRMQEELTAHVESLEKIRALRAVEERDFKRLRTEKTQSISGMERRVLQLEALVSGPKSA